VADGRLGPEEDAASRYAAAALDVAQDVARAGGVPGAESAVTVRFGTSALSRFAESRIHQSVTEDVRELTLTITVDGRTAAVSGAADGWPGPDGLRRLAEAALAATRHRPVDPHWPGLAPPAEILPAAHADRATADATAGERAELVAGFVDAADGLETAGYCATRGIATAFANSAGQRTVGSVTAVTIDGIARKPFGGAAPADGSGRASSVRIAEVSGETAGRTAGEIARAAAEQPADVEPGEYPVVLRPGAVVDVLTWLAMGLGVRPHAEGRSFAEPGTQQFDPLIALRCDPFDPRFPTLPFDGEGTPREAYDLISDGVVTTLAADRRDAATYAGVRSNGGALSHRYVTSALPAALVLRPGTEAPDELYAGLRQALVITDFWYTRLLDSRRLVVTGLTRNGVFLVEDGIITRPVRNVRFTQSYAEALGPGRVLGLDGESVFSEGEALPTHTPSLALTSWQITGNAQG
jgi:predicted Zn-dependent protease